MAKTSAFSKKRKADPLDVDVAAAFVQGVMGDPGPSTSKRVNRPAAHMVRTTLDLDAELLKRVKVAAIMRGTTLADIVRGLLEKEFPG